MVWQAICSCGLRSPSFVTSSTMNSDVFVKECLQKRLLPLYRQHDSPPAWYEANLNPPNVPELRPIETYWALTKRACKKIGSVAQNIKSFKAKWKRASEKVEIGTVRSLMGGVKTKVRQFSEQEVVPKR
jgi:hypothetical protein